jgi:hypothetical protein
MTAPHTPYIPLGEDDNQRTNIYDPTDPFWQDIEEDDDDMDYHPAPGDSQDEEDDNGELSFHGMFFLLIPLSKHDLIGFRRCRREPHWGGD